jgi:hypothetical protein
VIDTEPAHNEVLSHLDSNDSRMQQVVYANNPGSAKVIRQGYLALADNNVIYPAIGFRAGAA